MIEQLTSRGWDVVPMYFGEAFDHCTKYKFWNIAMRNDHASLPEFLWNKHGCKYLIEFINNADAREGRNGVEKVKSDECKDALDQRYTTHHSDAMDMLALGKYAEQLNDVVVAIAARAM